MSGRTRLACVLAALGAAAAPARAALPASALAQVGVRPPPGAVEPPGLDFTDADSGRRTTLAAVAGGRPLVLVFADAGCATLCGPALAIVGERLGQARLAPGRDVRLAVVDLRPDAPLAGVRAFADGRLPAAVRRAATPLVGDAAAVRRATAAVGYRYVWDGAARQFAHPVAAFVLAPDGRLTDTLSEVALTPGALEGAVADARAGRTGGLLQEVALACHGVLEAAGRFDPAVLLGLRGAGVATVAGLAGSLVWLSRRRRAPA